MKILIVASTMVHIKNFHIPYIDKLKELGHEVFVLAGGEGADYNIPFKKRTLSIKNLLLVSKIKKILKTEKFDAVYLHTTLAAFYVRLAMKKLKNRPYVINTVHGYLFPKNEKGLKKKIYLKCEKVLKNQTDDIFVMNQEDYEIATENQLCTKKMYKINGMGISLKNENTDKKNNDFINLTFVGEISSRKNQEFLVKALKEIPNAKLTLVGDGNNKNKILKLAKRLNVANRLEITGFTKQVYKYLSQTDIYVSASKIEGLPFNILEAMSMKLPIVASNIKGHVDLLPNDCLFELDNMQEFVKKVKEIQITYKAYDLEKYKLENTLAQNIELYLSSMNL